MRFKPAGKRRFKHYYKYPAMEANEEWDSFPCTCFSCADDAVLKESVHPYSEQPHIRY